MSKQARLVAVIDDDEGVGKAVCRLLKSDGHRVDRFGSAEEWLSADHRANAACLILDVRLPGLTGFELQQHLLASRSQIPIIFFSAHADEVLRKRALEAGAIDFLSKPVDVERLLDLVCRVVGNGHSKK